MCVWIRIEPLVDIKKVFVDHQFGCSFVWQHYPIAACPFFDHSDTSFYSINVFVRGATFNCGIDLVLDFSEFSVTVDSFDSHFPVFIKL